MIGGILHGPVAHQSEVKLVFFDAGVNIKCLHQNGLRDAESEAAGEEFYKWQSAISYQLSDFG